MPIPSLFTGAIALTEQQNAISVVSNNIANINTTGFKGSKVHFEESVSNTLRPSSAPGTTFGGTNPSHVGTGMRISDINTVFSQGALKTTGLASDLALSGDGFFVVSPSVSDDAANVGNKKYTRDGHFMIDSNENLVNASGDKVIGATLYEPGSGKVKTVDGYSNLTYFTDQTMGSGIVPNDGGTGNLAVPTPAVTVLGGGTAASFDSSKLAELSIRGNLIDSGTAVNTGDLAVTKQDDGKLLFSYTDSANGTFEVAINPDNQYLDNVVSLDMINSTSGTKVQLRMRLEPGVTSVDEVFKNIDYNSTTAVSDSITFAGAAATTQSGGDITVGNDDFAFLSVSDLKHLESPIKIPNLFYAQDPSVEIETSNFSIGADGTVSVYGPASQELKLGRVLVANFVNPDGLINNGGNNFVESSNSGQAGITVVGGPFDSNAPSIAGTKIVSGTLETSNVNMADEFAELISYQRGLQANGRVITTADEILQTLLNV